ncbi:MAG: arginine repressor [Acidimicrobiia bacterium]
MNGAARRRVMRRILSSGTMSSQTELVGVLAGEGFEVTQATVSRDLKALGASKVRGADGGFAYTLGVDQGEDVDLARTLAEFAGEIMPSGNLVVIKTPPGAAQVVAGAIDRSALDHVLGTVAGDDTVLVIVDETGGNRLAKLFERIGAG